MTPEEFEREMVAIRNRYGSDYEGFHIRADELMCTILKAYGLGAGIDIFEKAKKWYA